MTPKAASAVEKCYLTLNEPATRGRIVDRVEVKLDLTTDQ